MAIVAGEARCAAAVAFTSPLPVQSARTSVGSCPTAVVDPSGSSAHAMSDEKANALRCRVGTRSIRVAYCFLVDEYVYVVAVNKHCEFLWTNAESALRSTDCQTDTLAHKRGTDRVKPE
jgi:hypothetical protein